MTDLSAYLNRGEGLNPEKEQRVAQVVADIVKVIQTIPCKIDLCNPENVRRLTQAVNDAEAQMELFTPLPAS